MKRLFKQSLTISFKAALAAFFPLAMALHADQTNINPSPVAVSLATNAALSPSRAGLPGRTGLAAGRLPPGWQTNHAMAMPAAAWLGPQTNAPSSALRVTENGPHQRVWRDQAGHSIKAIASGMNFYDGQQWIPSDPSFQVTSNGDAFVAGKVQHKTRLASNLNVIGAVTVTTPDGQVLHSTPVGIGLYDSASGNSLIIGAITNCAGVLVNSNQVIYQNAFSGVSGVSADVVYSVNCGSIAQDVVLTANVDPADYGFPTNTTRIQVFSEFYWSPQPDVIVRPIYVEQSRSLRASMASPDLVDQTLGFGQLVIGPGKAYTAGTRMTGGAPVAKQFSTIAGRTFLIESVRYPSIQPGLKALPKTGTITPATVAALVHKGKTGYAAIPSPHPATEGSIAASPIPARVAKIDRKAGVVIDYLAVIGGTMDDNFVFPGDTTYFVSGPVYCPGNVTIEGGSVFKYPNDTTAFIEIGGSLTCKTSPYHPAIFTAGDDVNIGMNLHGLRDYDTQELIWPGCTDVIQEGGYAAPALVLDTDGATLSNLRFCYAQLAVHSVSSVTIADSQLVNCILGILIDVSSGTTITLNNCLVAGIPSLLNCNEESYGGDSAYNFNHCTVEDSAVGAAGNGSAYYIHCTNSIFSDSIFDGGGVVYADGSHNGFYNFYSWDNYDPDFGSYTSHEQQWPFAPTVWAIDPTDNQPLFYFVNGQGAFYLRDSSPFFNAGTTAIDPSLRNDITQRTTRVPLLLPNNFNSDETLCQSPIRDTATPALGYHYPAVDYVTVYTAVNGSTLTINQGTVLSYTGGLPFGGIVLNAGSSLIVNGTPTNRVTFARLEAVQENPTSYWQSGEPTVAFMSLDGSDIPDNMPSVLIRYADFPTVPITAYNFNIGPLFGTYHAPVSDFGLDGCHFQGGAIWYEGGNSVAYHNTVFENAFFGGFEIDNVGSALTAANNLFYNCELKFHEIMYPEDWTFTDNIFDTPTWSEDGIVPGCVDQYNAYINAPRFDLGTKARHISGGVPLNTFPNLDLTSIIYQTGPLGDFYLSPDDLDLIGHGSKSAAAAGQYHFTSFASNVKEGTHTQVNIGPHFVALDNNGRPMDADGDGVPDYLENWHGDGNYSAHTDSETDWQVADTDPIKFVGLTSGQVLPPGRVQIRVWATNLLNNLVDIALTADGSPILGTEPLEPPFSFPLTFDVDTTRLGNGTHDLEAVATWDLNTSDDEGSFARLQASSPSIALTVNNEFSYPEWIANFGEGLMSFNVASIHPLADYQIDILDENHNYVDTVTGVTASDGSIEASWEEWYGAPVYYSFITVSWVEGASTRSTTTITPRKFKIVDNYPPVGKWIVAYQDCFANNSEPHKNDSPPAPNMLNIIYSARLTAAEAGGIIEPTAGGGWSPIRFGNSYNLADRVADWDRLRQVLGNMDVRNLYYLGHGGSDQIGAGKDDLLRLTSDQLSAILKRNDSDPANRHFFRYVFLDGCNTANGKFPEVFGIMKKENVPIERYDINHLRPSAFSGWTDYKDYAVLGDIPEQFPLYRINFFSYWTESKWTLKAAHNQARLDARGTGLAIGESLKIFGYSELGYKDYNTH